MLSQRKKKSVASVKAPSDLKKFSLVQINNQAPPPKKQKVKPGKKTPPSSNLIQTDQKIKLTEQVKTEVQLQVKSTIQAVQKAFTDTSEGAKDRAQQNAFLWLKYDDPIPTPSGVTIQQGMQMTGGYKGTDFDLDPQMRMNEDIQLHIDQYQQERLSELKKQRRLLREKLLCAKNCELQKWTYLTGMSLNPNCPIDCPMNELNGQMKFKTSISALEAFNSYFEVRDQAKNKEELQKLDFQIEETNKGYNEKEHPADN